MSRPHDAAKRRYVAVGDDGRLLGPTGIPGVHCVFDTRELVEQAIAQSPANVRATARIVAVRLARFLERQTQRRGGPQS